MEKTNLIRGALYRVRTRNNCNQLVEEVRLSLGPYKGLGLKMEKMIQVKPGDKIDYVASESDFTINGVLTKNLDYLIESDKTFEVLGIEPMDEYIAA